MFKPKVNFLSVASVHSVARAGAHQAPARSVEVGSGDRSPDQFVVDAHIVAGRLTVTRESEEAPSDPGRLTDEDRLDFFSCHNDTVVLGHEAESGLVRCGRDVVCVFADVA